jgi:SAM-dependent methyltransferase
MGGDRDLWDAHAATDPLWAVLSDPEKKGRRWTLQEFMRNGEREVALLIRKLAELRLPAAQAPVLDFGCGVGRLAQALGRRFDDVTGADISPQMIALARRVNQYPGRVRYICTSDTPIDTLPGRSFRFIYSNIVLQHIAPDVSVRILGEFFRLLDAGGLLVFQLPSHQPLPGDMEIVPMTEDAYRGSVELAGPAPAVASPGEAMAVPIIVRNATSRTWSQPGAGPMAAGNHWLDASGALMLHQDDGRAPLPQVMRGGEACRLVLRMRAPSAPGTYVAEIDLVHEGVTWFEYKGSPTLRFPIEVRSGQAPSAPETRVPLTEYVVPEYPEDALQVDAPGAVAAPPDADPFPMHGVPHGDVLAIIARHGGRLRHVEEDRHAGADWVSYTYFVEGRGTEVS